MTLESSPSQDQASEDTDSDDDHSMDEDDPLGQKNNPPASSPAPGMFDIFQSCLVGFLMTDCSMLHLRD